MEGNNTGAEVTRAEVSSTPNQPAVSIQKVYNNQGLILRILTVGLISGSLVSKTLSRPMMLGTFC